MRVFVCFGCEVGGWGELEIRIQGLMSPSLHQEPPSPFSVIPSHLCLLSVAGVVDFEKLVLTVDPSLSNVRHKLLCFSQGPQQKNFYDIVIEWATPLQLVGGRACVCV